MKQKRNAASQMALCGLLGALAVVVMLAGEIVPLATFCCPVIVMFLMVPVMQECGRKLALVWYVAVGLLSLMLTFSNPEATMIFLFLGYYPLLRAYLERLRPMVLRILVKLIYFNAMVAAAYGTMIFVLKLDAISQEFQDSARWLLIVTVLLANVCFFMVERVLKGFEVYYIVKLRRKIFRK